MNPALTTNLLTPGKSIENNGLSAIDGASDGLSDELFSGEFSSAMDEVLSADGKLKPLDFATLKELGIQDLTELENISGIKLPTDAIELEQQPTLNMLALETDEQLESIGLFGNPATAALIETTKLSSELSERDLLNKPQLLVGRAINDAVEQPMLKKEVDLSRGPGEIDLSKQMKQLANGDVDISSELLTTTAKQETNVAKFVDQLASIDKWTNNAINPANNPLKTYSNVNPTGTILNRIEVPVTQAGWGEAVGNRLMMMANGKVQSANIHLNPAELGPIEIRVNVNQDQVNVHFVSSNALVREAIEDAFPRLKEMFVQNGLSLNDADVSQQSPQQGHASSGKDSDSTMSFNEESLEAADVQIENTNENMIDIGLVDQYV